LVDLFEYYSYAFLFEKYYFQAEVKEDTRPGNIYIEKSKT